MKNFFSTIGFTLLILGVIFKVQHWPGATVSIIGGLVVTVVSFILPKKEIKTTSSDLLDDEDISTTDLNSRGKKLAETIRSIGIGIIVISMVLKLLHLPGISILLIVGCAIAISGALLRLKYP